MWLILHPILVKQNVWMVSKCWQYYRSYTTSRLWTINKLLVGNVKPLIINEHCFNFQFVTTSNEWFQCEEKQWDFLFTSFLSVLQNEFWHQLNSYILHRLRFKVLKSRIYDQYWRSLLLPYPPIIYLNLPLTYFFQIISVTFFSINPYWLLNHWMFTAVHSLDWITVKHAKLQL